MNLAPRWHAVWAITLLALSLGGCAEQRAWKQADPWFDAPKWEPRMADGLDVTRIDTVLDRHEREAEEMLATQTFVEISPRLAEDLVGLPLRGPTGARTFLVRGVYLHRSTGVFQAYYQPDGSLLVINECMGSQTTTMKRQALVLQLDGPPRHVWVVCRMEE